MAFELGRGDSHERPNASTRSAASAFCPKVSLDRRAGLRLHDKLLRNLGHGLMGESRYYRGTGLTFDTHVGFEILDVYEDLDFVSRGTVAVGGREFRLSRAGGVNAPFWVGATFLGAWPDGCGELTLVGRGRGMTGPRFRELLAAVRLPQS